jgi:hypothetical protein
MAGSSNNIDVYFEIGQKKAFAGAIDWPGWCRIGRDEESALQALFDYGPRYAGVLRTARLGFQAPQEITVFRVVERLEGDATTDFGAPGAPPSSDAQPVSDDELERFQRLLQACWRAFDAACQQAAGKELRKGPRGGGRDLDKIIGHVLGSDQGYLSQLGWKLERQDREAEGVAALDKVRKAFLTALPQAALGEIPAVGPRGGARWTSRYFVRRSAWHVLDHTWEIEDRQI